MLWDLPPAEYFGNESLHEERSETDVAMQSSTDFPSGVGTDLWFSQEVENLVLTCDFDTCVQVFTSASDLQDHYLSAHKLDCTVCKAHFITLKELQEHTKQNKHLNKCNFCDYEHLRKFNVVRHVQNFHKPITCESCEEEFVGMNGYNRHNRLNKCKAPHIAMSMLETHLGVSPQKNGQPENHDCDDRHDLVSFTRTASATTSTVDTSSHSACATDASNGTAEIRHDFEPPQNVESVHSHEEVPLVTSDTGGEMDLSFPQIFCPVIFGPGAFELDSSLFLGEVSDNASYITADTGHSKNKVDMDVTEWVGHSISTFQNVSKQYQKMYRFICEYCSMPFKSKKFFKIHTIRHSLFARMYTCITCHEKKKGLKNIALHELLHHMISELEKRMGDINDDQPSSKGKRMKCKTCCKNVPDYHHLIRHEVWHKYDDIWENYVSKKSRKCKQVEMSVLKTLKTKIKFALRHKWLSKKFDLGDLNISVEIDNSDMSVSRDAYNSYPQSDDSEDEDDDDDNARMPDYWLDYWQSYLGLSDLNTPRWVLPLLRHLSQFNNHSSEEQQMELYRSMDQISSLLGVQKMGNSSYQPRVILQKLSPRNNQQESSDMCELKKPEVNLDRKSLQLVKRSSSKILCGSKETSSFESSNLCEHKMPVVVLQRLPLHQANQSSVIRGSKEMSCCHSWNSKDFGLVNDQGPPTTSHSGADVQERSSSHVHFMEFEPRVVVEKLDTNYMNSDCVTEWSRRILDGLPTPKWALPVMNDLWNASLCTNKFEADKVKQIKMLVKAERKDRGFFCTHVSEPKVVLDKLELRANAQSMDFSVPKVLQESAVNNVMTVDHLNTTKMSSFE